MQSAELRIAAEGVVYYDYRGGYGQFSQKGGGTHGTTKTHTAL